MLETERVRVEDEDRNLDASLLEQELLACHAVVPDADVVLMPVRDV
jgi:hypothetical protein